MWIVSAAAALLAATAAPAPVAGRWITPDGVAMVEIGACGETLCGHVARVLRNEPGAAQTDIHNPDPAARARPIVGLAILTGLEPGRDDWRGRIYDPRSGGSYRAIVRRDGAMLEVKGCLGPICQTQRWRAA